ncbi:hypothetical protein MAR_025206 [Mya arenaria]|uniref:Uncharacterized protein n=1 Tax=Mya arenaria TaxID=6604 RepID=A0ABY7DUS4_MYAAR|nr:hypothetical protein MAR_025206 [Mya arenaria]
MFNLREDKNKSSTTEHNYDACGN